MKKFYLLLFLLFILRSVYAEQPKLALTYDYPAINWMTSALPIGNGVFGAMFFGGVTQEHIQFNDKTLWSGSTTSRGSYQNFGDLFLNFQSHTTYTNYKRELSLDEAIGKVSYKVDNVTYMREYFASNPDSAIVMRLTTPNQSGKLTFTVNLTDAHPGTTLYIANKIIIRGLVDVLNYEAQVLILNEGGTLTTTSNKISVSGADAVTIILTGSTNYNIASPTYVSESSSALHNRITTRIETAKNKTYEQLKNAHLNDYQPLFSRVKLDLNASVPVVNTEALIRLYKENTYLDILHYQYGRYLMIASSRGLALPSNLQGLWNNTNTPAWECDIHSNINVQMNYWPAENSNLSECHLPFLNYVNIESLKSTGSWKAMAKSLNCDGWTLKTQNNIFGYSDWNWNRPANAWYCMHLWDHFAYTNDTTYLRNIAFPTMKSACEFWFKRLITNSSGKLVAPDEWSPEHGDWEDNIAYAQQLIWELFNSTLKAAHLISADIEFVNTLTTKFSQLDNGVKIGSWGQIREWTTQADVQGDTHRHISQLIALYPGNQISLHRDAGKANAAITTLNSRGDGGTGWSRAWKIACWARLFDGDHAYKLMKAAQNLSVTTVVEMYDGHGGVYENLLDAHPSYQIDGNFGFTAGVTEMLIQSNQGFIQLLPALPSVWPNGSYTGLKAIGNFTIDLQWKNSLPQQATIYSGSGDSCSIYFPNIEIKSLVDGTGNNVQFIQKSNNEIAFNSVAGKKYYLVFKEATINPNSITPYIQINNNQKIQTNSANVTKGGSVLLSPESTSNEGSWSWIGPNSFTASGRELLLTNLDIANSGNYIATQTLNGVKFVQVFNVTVLPEYNIKLNVLPAANYYIKLKDTELYLTNTNVNATGGKPQFLQKNIALPESQMWTVSLDGGFYKIVSKADNRYLNEKGEFGVNAYYQNWNTFNIYSDSIYCALQITQESASLAYGAYFWALNGSNNIEYSDNIIFDESKNLLFEFVPALLTGTSVLKKSSVHLSTKTKVLNVLSDIDSQLIIYNIVGSIVESTQVKGYRNISLEPGVYIVKVLNKNEESTTKILIR